MAINFWEAQRKARSNTKFYVAVFILITVGMAVAIDIALRNIAPQQYHPPLPVLGMVFLGVTFAVALFQYSMFGSYGGSYVAESVGAKKIDPMTTNLKHRQLLNIVEEMAVAASVPVPPVYIIPAHQINAFAAGLTKDKAAVAITEGALEKLNRDEVQGVIAHEFGHVYNGDMKISMQLAAMVMGFFFVLYLAFRLLQFASLSGRRRSGGDQKGGNPILLAALLLIGAGAVTWFAGSILKASVSREREYLADASAVQFTRNPHGIANALRKIGEESHQDMPKSGMAFSHMYLDNHMGLNALFATHPPLEKRIAALEGKGRYDYSHKPKESS